MAFVENEFTGIYERNYKIIVVGEPGVGKTSLLARHVANQFQLNGTKMTQGMDTFTEVKKEFRRRLQPAGGGGGSRKQPELVETTTVIQYLDIAGQDCGRIATPAFYRHLDAAVLVCDITRLESTLSFLPLWLFDIERNHQLELDKRSVRERKNRGGDRKGQRRRKGQKKQKGGEKKNNCACHGKTSNHPLFVETSSPEESPDDWENSSQGGYSTDDQQPFQSGSHPIPEPRSNSLDEGDDETMTVRTQATSTTMGGGYSRPNAQHYQHPSHYTSGTRRTGSESNNSTATNNNRPGERTHLLKQEGGNENGDSEKKRFPGQRKVSTSNSASSSPPSQSRRQATTTTTTGIFPPLTTGDSSHTVTHIDTSSSLKKREEGGGRLAYQQLTPEEMEEERTLDKERKTQYMLQRLHHIHIKPIWLLINKMDLTSLTKPEEEKVKKFCVDFHFVGYRFVSAANGENVKKSFESVVSDLEARYLQIEQESLEERDDDEDAQLPRQSIKLNQRDGEKCPEVTRRCEC